MSNPSDNNGTRPPVVGRDSDFDAEASTGQPTGDGHEPQPAAKKMPEWQLLVLAVLAIVGIWFWPVWFLDVGLGLYWYLGLGGGEGGGLNKRKLLQGAAWAAAAIAENKAGNGGDAHGHGGDSHGHGGGGHGGGSLIDRLIPSPPNINPKMKGIIRPPAHRVGTVHLAAGRDALVMNLRHQDHLFVNGVGMDVAGVPVRIGPMMTCIRSLAECIAEVDLSPQTGVLHFKATPGGNIVMCQATYTVQAITEGGHVTEHAAHALLHGLDSDLDEKIATEVARSVQAAGRGKGLEFIVDASNLEWISENATVFYQNALKAYGVTGSIELTWILHTMLSQAKLAALLIEKGVPADTASTLAFGHDPTGGAFGGGILGVQRPGGQQESGGSRSFVVKGSGKKRGQKDD